MLFSGDKNRKKPLTRNVIFRSLNNQTSAMEKFQSLSLIDCILCTLMDINIIFNYLLNDEKRR